MKTEQEQINEIAKTMCEEFGTDVCNYDCPCINTCANKDISERLYSAGYRKANDVIDEFVERINLIECEMFHRAHDVRNSCEYKIDHGNTDDRVWGDKRACDGKMVALQDFMTKIEKLADEMRKEVKNG